MILGACGTLVGHPLDTIKAWQQATNSTIKHATYHIMVHNNNGVGLSQKKTLCTI